MKMALCRIVLCIACLVDARAPSEKLSPRQQLLQLLQQAPSTASPATLAEVAGALGSLALEADHSKDDGTTIEAIRKLMTELTTAIEQQHTEAQTALQSHGNFQTCLDAKEQAFGEAAKMVSTTTSAAPTTTSTSTTTTAGPTTTTLHPDLAACKAQEAELILRNKTCHSELVATHSAKTATCELYNEINYPSAGAARIARCADSTLFSGSYEDFLERDIQMLATLRQREQNCTDTSSVYSSKSAECDAITIALSDKLKECLAMEVQLSYDSSFTIDSYQDYSQPSTDNLTHYYDPVTQTNCGPYEAKVVACSNYAACYTSEVSMMDSSYLSAKELSSSRQAEMTALNRIVCLLDVLQLPAAEQPAKLTECIAAIHDVSSLNLVKPVAPAKAACDPGATPAGCVTV